MTDLDKKNKSIFALLFGCYFHMVISSTIMSTENMYIRCSLYKNSLKENIEFMDVSSTTMTVTHLLIIWALLSALLLWIFLFAFLALRPEREKVIEEFPHVFTTQTLTPPVAQSQSVMSLPTSNSVHEQVGEAVPLV